MKKLFISVPMKGRTEEAIKESMEKMHKIAEIIVGEELEVIPSYVEDNPPKGSKEAVWYLGKSIQMLADADYIVGGENVWDWSGCTIERDVARQYQIPAILLPVHFIAPDAYEALSKDEGLSVEVR